MLGRAVAVALLVLGACAELSPAVGAFEHAEPPCSATDGSVDACAPDAATDGGSY